MKLLPNVSRVIPVGKPYKLASKNYKKDNSIVKIKDLSIGGKNLAIIAGPDSAETKEQTIETAVAAKDAAEAALVGMYSPSEFQELRAGSTVIAVSAGEATINLQLEESSDLSSWIDLGDAVPFTVTLDPSDDTQFFRVKLAD